MTLKYLLSTFCSVLLFATLSTPVMAADSLSGTVLETMNASSYTYIRLKSTQGEVWAAVPQAEVKVGSKVDIHNPQPMNGFESKTLKRKFDKIFFGTLDAQATNEPAPAGMASGGTFKAAMNGATPHGQAASHPAVDLSKIKVSKASGPSGHTIAELYAQKATLKDKEVTVRGQVVKYNAAIMKKNWLHISDGTGSEATKDFDLTVTSDHPTQVGDIVVVKGKLRADKSIGAGYFFPALIEDASLQKE
ncbi:nucleotide-binding protein [Bdellovibrionota bacterium FG-1]